jgi:hypothetical protein
LQVHIRAFLQYRVARWDLRSGYIDVAPAVNAEFPGSRTRVE